MKALIQRVNAAHVAVQSRTVASIGRGLLLFVGVFHNDTPDDCEYIAKKIVNFRIFEDETGRMNLNVLQVNGQILSVPQFTLCAETGKGNRPGFDRSAPPESARELWGMLNNRMAGYGASVHEGEFGSHMDITLTNDGPVTFMLDSKKSV